jgi:AraC-like DNA-binding protein
MTSQRIVLEIPPWPTYRSSSYRQFEHGEKHVTRVAAEYVLLLMLENTLHFTESDVDIELEAGEWYLQIPGFKQEGRRGSPAPFYYYIHFAARSSPESGEEREDGASLLAMPIRGRFDASEMRPRLDRLDATARRRPSDILGLQSLFLEVLNRVATPEEAALSPSRRLADAVADYIASHCDRPAIGKELPERFHYSYDYLQRLLKTHYGVTPGQWIQACRIKRAQQLLEHSDVSLAQIAAETGYQDPTVFYKAFRKLTGEAPGRWRRRKRGLS